MTKRIVVGSSLVVACAAVFLWFGGSQADAVRPFSERSLRGEYHFNLVEIREESGVIDYCDEFGVATFDGAGGMSAISTRRCSFTGYFPDVFGEFTYSVDAGGSVEIQEVGFTEITHAQIVDGGRMLLIDGTTRTDLFVQNGVAVKR